jgi:hypothetical protein
MAKTTIVSLGIAAVLVVAVVVVLLTAARPISSDLSALGQGRPALVLAYENYSPTGGEALARLGSVRADYEPRMDFRVADLGTPHGRAFADRHGLRDGLAVFLKPAGAPPRVPGIPADEQQLRQRLDAKLADVATGGGDG